MIGGPPRPPELSGGPDDDGFSYLFMFVGLWLFIIGLIYLKH